MEWTGRYNDNNWNRSLLTYRFSNGSYIEFFSAEMESKLRGARRNILYINEANNITFESYHQLAVRTSGEIWLDFNPTNEFWAHTELMSDEDTEHIILTYKDNEALPDTIIHDIEAAELKAKTSTYWANWWQVYGLGQVGSLQDVIFDQWKQIDTIPEKAELVGHGMDFGFTNDPSTLVAIYKYEGKLIIDELLYRTNMTNNDLGNFLKSIQFGRKELICDSAEPKSIEELRLQGFNVRPAVKGADSIKIGIDILKRYEIQVTKNSTNLIKELRGYTWEKDNEGKLTGKPIDSLNHCFIGETLITTDKGFKRIDEIKIGDKVLTSKGYKKVLHNFNNGLKQVNKYSIQLDTNVVYLDGTINHKIKTNTSWTELSKLQKGQKLYQHKPLIIKNTLFTIKKNILVEVIKDYIQMFGNIIMVKYLKTIMCIMSMGILTIMKYRILILFIKHCILDLKQKKDLKTILNLQKNFMQEELKQQKNGTNQKMVLNGTNNKLKRVGLIDLLKIKYANNAERITQLDTQEFQNSVIKTARLKHLEIGESYNAIVYDLMIEECHEYFANGVLVHNCVDPMRYVALLKLNNRPSGKYSTISI